MKTPVIHVVCPVCTALLDFDLPEGRFELWGSILITSPSIGQVTLPYSQESADHIAAHQKDGTWWDASAKHFQQMADSSEAYRRAAEQQRTAAESIRSATLCEQEG